MHFLQITHEDQLSSLPSIVHDSCRLCFCLLERAVTISLKWGHDVYGFERGVIITDGMCPVNGSVEQ
jgi:hypothetical protein